MDNKTQSCNLKHHVGRLCKSYNRTEQNFIGGLVCSG